MILEHLFCLVDDFCNEFLPEWEKELIGNLKIKKQTSRLSESEIMTIIIYFHMARFRDFKTFYIHYVQKYLTSEFPNLVSYNRFVELMQTVLMPLCFFMLSQNKTHTGIYFVDSMHIKACHIKREKQNRVFKDIAKKSKTTIGWFFGFKIHLIINDMGEIMAFKMTPGNVDDRVPVPELAKGLTGKMFGDKGYIKKELFEKLFDKGLQLITKIKKNMKSKLMPILDKILLRKRAIIESVNDQLKNLCQIEHTRHRSINNFMVNIVGALTAYTLQEKKPSLNLRDKQLVLI